MAEKWNVARQSAGSVSSRSNGGHHLSVVHRHNGDNHGLSVVEHSPLLSGIPAGDYTIVSAAARVREFARGEMLYAEGDSVQHVLLLTSGFAKITQLGPGGTEVILRFCVLGDVLGAVGLFSNGRHYTTAQAFRPCRALIWEAPTFDALVKRFPVLQQNMVRVLGEDLRELQERFREVATERVAPRVARQLLRLLEKMGRPVNGLVEVGLSREELAQMTGTTLFTVSRLLSTWEADGIVRPRREAVAICDEQALRAIFASS
jgi:CRP-like cAMP-binding protein